MAKWLNIRGTFLYKEIPVMTFSHKKDDIKQTLKYIVFMLFAH